MLKLSQCVTVTGLVHHPSPPVLRGEHASYPIPGIVVTNHPDPLTQIVSSLYRTPKPFAYLYGIILGARRSCALMLDLMVVHSPNWTNPMSSALSMGNNRGHHQMMRQWRSLLTKELNKNLKKKNSINGNQ
jgi:hypothetical protein